MLFAYTDSFSLDQLFESMLQGESLWLNDWIINDDDFYVPKYELSFFCVVYYTMLSEISLYNIEW